MAARHTPPIALLTDFGADNWYVASLKGVITGICPAASLLDISHAIPPYDVMTGAFTLAAAAPWFPPRTIFVCVVDPGVGSDRAIVAAEADGQVFIGPDNGVLSVVLARASRVSMVRVAAVRYRLPSVSRTFHGRDIMAPAAAHVANGVPLRSLGAPVTRYRHLAMPSVTRTARGLRGSIVLIDHFGNLITNLPSEKLRPLEQWEVLYRQKRLRVVSSYERGRSGELVALPGSVGYVELAMRQASAAARLKAARGEAVEMRRVA